MFAALLVLTFDTGRCMVWMTSYQQQEIEKTIQRTGNAELWQSYQRGREAVRVRGIRSELCQRLWEKHGVTLRAMRTVSP